MTPESDRRRPRRASVSDPSAIADRRARAIEEALDVRLQSRDPYPRLEVRNPLHGTGYLVMLPEFPDRNAALCTCTDFARRGLGTCKHIEAGVRWLAEHPDASPLRGAEWPATRTSRVWRKIDQREGAALRDPAPPAVRWRRPGAVLFEIGRKD
jgi:hypothetical protein